MTPLIVWGRCFWSRAMAGRPGLLSAALLTAALPLSTQVQAGAAQWSSTNIQYLYGDAHQSIYFDPDKMALDSTDDVRSVITLEHVNGWKYGDNFFFVDITNADREDATSATEFYGEISPRLSFSKMSGKSVSAGIIKDVLFTATLEVGDYVDVDGSKGFHNYLYGLAVDLDLPGVPVFQVNYYVRNEHRDVPNGKVDTGSQITLVWVKPFTVGGLNFVFEGFFDYAYGVDPLEDNIITAPRLLLDVGALWGSPGVLQAGVEYQIWRNKFGIDGIDEDVAQAMLKWIW